MKMDIDFSSRERICHKVFCLCTLKSMHTKPVASEIKHLTAIL